MAKQDSSVSAEQALASDSGVNVRGCRFESAEASLRREQAEADLRTPDWDLASRITTARGAMKRGVPADTVRKAYGERVYLAAAGQEAESPFSEAAD